MPGKGKICIVCNKTRASCAASPTEKPTHCGKCKEDGMSNVTISKCAVCKIKIPNFGKEGEKSTHCKECKEDDMIDLRTSKCEKCKKKQPVYNREGLSPKYCVGCKDTDMVDVRSKMCVECKKKQPSFGLPNGKPTHCALCKENDMIDIKSTKCIVCNIKFPSYGLPGKKNTHCADCRTDEHIDVKNAKCEKCKEKQPTYGNLSTREIKHCKSCKLDTDIDLKHELCKSGICDNTRANARLNGYCAWCFQHLFPESPLSKTIVRKSFELEVATAILNYDNEYKHDTRLAFGGCDCLSRRRVDFWKVIGNTILAIEVDEHQHKGYDEKDEEIRYDDLYMVFSGKWIFIRFNPNTFKEGTKRRNIPLKNRIPKLLEEIKIHEQRALEEKNLDLLEIHRLFFNC